MLREGREIPRSGPGREVLREKGQFWTPDWVAEAMVTYVLRSGTRSLLDPAVGNGVFFRAAARLASEAGKSVSLIGYETDPEVLKETDWNGLFSTARGDVRLANFLTSRVEESFGAIVANPPYIRHHRLPADLKASLRSSALKQIGAPIDGRAGIHIYFLLRALQLLDHEGRLSFIMPADTCEGTFAKTLWSWITKNYCLDAVITFTPEASPFPDVDTNALIFMIRRSRPKEKFAWFKCDQYASPALRSLAGLDFSTAIHEGLGVVLRDLAEGLRTGLSRQPDPGRDNRAPVLGDFADVVRGIATGANEFFFLTRERARALGIPDRFLVTALGRTRDVEGEEITEESIRVLESSGRPTRLVSIPPVPLETLPMSVRGYIEHGEQIGLSRRPLLSTRRPWYKMETRPVPPILFAYLGRRNTRFVRNWAGVVPLTGFLCIYPKSASPEYLDKLWNVLRDPRTISNLATVGKSYGGGAIKVEPRPLENLPIPSDVSSQFGLQPINRAKQLSIF